MAGENSSAERSPVAGDAARLVRHEVRNHLTTILNAAHFVRLRLQASAGADLDPRIPRFLGMIERAVEDANAELDGLRDGRACLDSRDGSEGTR